MDVQSSSSDVEDEDRLVIADGEADEDEVGAQWTWSQPQLLYLAQLVVTHAVLWGPITTKSKAKCPCPDAKCKTRQHALAGAAARLGVSTDIVAQRLQDLKYRFHELTQRTRSAEPSARPHEFESTLARAGRWAPLLHRATKRGKKSTEPVKSKEMEESSEVVQFKRALLRHMTVHMRDAAVGVRMLEGLARQYACTPRDMLTVWYKVRAIALHKLRAHVSTGDAARAPCVLAAPTPLDWRLINLVLCRDANYCITTHESTRLPEQLRSLICLFHLAQACGVEGGPPAAWLHLYHKYKESGRYMTLVGLQKRWWEMKRAAAMSILHYHKLLHEGKKVPAEQHPPYIYCALARRYPHVVTRALPRWSDLVEEGHVIVSTSSYKKKFGVSEVPDIEYSEVTVFGDDRGQDTQCLSGDIDDDIILVDKEIETIVLDDDEEHNNASDPNSIFQLNPNKNDISTRIIFESDGSDDDYFFEAETSKPTSEVPANNREDLDEEIRNLSLSIQQDILEGPQNASVLTTEIDIKQEKDPVVESQSDIDNRGSSDVENDANNREVSDSVVDEGDDIVENLINSRCSEVLSRMTEGLIKRELAEDVPGNADTVLFEAGNIKIESCRSLHQNPCLPPVQRSSSHSDDNTADAHNDSDSEPEDVKPNVDLKLIMIPLVPLRRLDHTDSWRKYSLHNQIYASLIDMKEFEPIKKRRSRMKAKEATTPDRLTVMNVATHPLEAPRLIRLNSTPHRNYTPISLCRNPDFNTRLKRLPVGFLLSNRNKDLMDQCMPLTVDVERLMIPAAVISSDDDDDVVEVMVAPVSRVLKRIQLPDIADVRRINKGLLTAEVTPIAVRGATQAEEPAAVEAGDKHGDHRAAGSLVSRRGGLSPRLQCARAGDVTTHRAGPRDVDRDESLTKNRRVVAAAGRGGVVGNAGGAGSAGRGAGRGGRARRAKPYYYVQMSRQGWWRPERAPDSTLDYSRLHETLNTLNRSAPEVSLRPTYCCAARRHRAVNDARRRVSAKLQRQYGGDKDLHTAPCKRVNAEACSCCCAALLEPPGEAIARGARALTRAIRSILDGGKTLPHYMNDLETADSTLPQPPPATVKKQIPPATAPPDTKQAPAAKPLDQKHNKKPKSNRLTKKKKEEKAKKEKEEEERRKKEMDTSKICTYEGWLQERNRVSQVFGIKPKNYSTKSVASNQTNQTQEVTTLTKTAEEPTSSDCVVLSDSDEDPPMSVDIDTTVELDANDTTDQSNLAKHSLLTEENVNAIYGKVTQDTPAAVEQGSLIDISSSPDDSNSGENYQSPIVSIGALVQVDPAEANTAANTTAIQKQMMGKMMVANNGGLDQQNNVGDGDSGQPKLLPVLLHADGSLTPFVVGMQSAIQLPTTSQPAPATVQTILPHGSTQVCVLNQPATMTAEVASTLVQRRIAPALPPLLPLAGGAPIKQGCGEFAEQYCRYYGVSLQQAAAETLPACEFVRGRDPTCIVLTQMDTSHPLFLLAGDTVCVCEREVWCREPWLWAERPVAVPPECLVKGSSGVAGGLLAAAAPGRVALGSKFYMKLMDAPLIYAQVLTILPNLREVREHLLQGRAVYLVSHRGRERLQGAPRRRRLALNCRIHRDALAALVRGLNAFVSAEEAHKAVKKKPTVRAPTAKSGALAIDATSADQAGDVTPAPIDNTVVVIDSDVEDIDTDTPAACSDAAPQPSTSKPEVKVVTPTSSRSLLKPIETTLLQSVKHPLRKPSKHPRKYGNYIVVDGIPAMKDQLKKRPHILSEPEMQFKKIRLTKPADTETKAETKTNITATDDIVNSQDDTAKLDDIPTRQTEKPIETPKTVGGKNMDNLMKIERVTMTIEPINSDDEQDDEDAADTGAVNEHVGDELVTEATVDEAVSEDLVDGIALAAVSETNDDDADAILGL